MKIFYSESGVDYSSYTFNYAIYCLKEHQQELPQIYDRGFLPYTGNLQIQENIFYLARSLRVDLEEFRDTSENRRVDRKVEELNIRLEVFKKSEFDITDPVFIDFCSAYAADRFSGGAMSKERFLYVLHSAITTHIFYFYNEYRNLGYVLACQEGNMLHYWFAFFDTEYMKSHSLGKWMMWRSITWAKENGLAHVYLGTCYGSHSLYKVRDHKGLEYFNGAGWSSDMKLLKMRCKTDQLERTADDFKNLDDPGRYLRQL